MRIKENLGVLTHQGNRYRVRAFGLMGCGYAKLQVPALTHLTAAELRGHTFHTLIGTLICRAQPLGAWFPERVHVLSGTPRTAYGYCARDAYREKDYFEWAPAYGGRIYSESQR
jgi:hypothetical protein